MTPHEDHEQTARLVQGIIQTWRDRQDEETPADQPAAATITGGDIEDQADALDGAAARLAEMLAAFTGQPRRTLDAIAVFNDLSRTAGAIAEAAAELRRQEWFDLDEEAEQEARDSWDAALAGLRAAQRTFAWIADGWI